MKKNILLFLLFTLLSFYIYSEDIKKISILPLKNNTQNSKFDWISMCIPDMMISDISKFKTFQIIEKKDLNSIYQEQYNSNSDEFNDEQAIKIGNLYTSTHIITGNYYLIDNKIRIDLKVLNLETGVIVTSVGLTSSNEELLTSEKVLVKDLLTNLGYQLTEPEKNLLYQIPTNSIKAVESFYNGLIAENEKNVIIALDSYENAKNYDPNYVDASKSYELTNNSITTGSLFDNAKNEIEEKKNQIKILKDLNDFIRKNLFVYKINTKPILVSTDIEKNTAEIKFEITANYNKKVLDMYEKVLISISKRNKGNEDEIFRFQKGKVVKEINLKLYRESTGILEDYFYGLKLYLIDNNNDIQGESYCSIVRGEYSDPNPNHSSDRSVFGNDSVLIIDSYDKLEYSNQGGRNSISIGTDNRTNKKIINFFISFSNVDIEVLDNIKEIRVVQINAWEQTMKSWYSFDDEIIFKND